MRFRSTLNIKIVIIVIVILSVITVLNGLIGSRVFTREYTDALTSKFLIVGQALRLQLDKLMGLGIPLEELVGFEDQCKELVKKYGVSYAMITDSGGKVLFHNNPEKHGSIIADAGLLRSIRSGKESIQVMTEGGDKVYDIVIPIFNDNNVLIGAERIGFPYDLVAQKTRRLLWHSAGVAFFVFILAAALLFFALSHWVTGPLLRLSRAIAGVSKKGADDAAFMQVTSADEIGRLAQDFNTMLEDLKKSHADVKLYTQKLELLVDERTKELKESESRFSQVAENAEEWFWEVDGKGFYTYSSPVVEKILGYKPEEIVGRKYFYDFFPPESREGLKRAAMEAFARKEPFRGFVNTNVHKDGRLVVLETSGAPLLDNQGVLLGYRGVDADITERRQHEERLALVNECLLNFGTDAAKNIQNLTVICGELLGATCALYNRLEGGMLCSQGTWNAPADYVAADKPEGHICYDVIKLGGDRPFLVRNLPQTPYSQLDPNVAKYNLQTYLGMAVKSGGVFIGSVCVVYQRDFIPSEDDQKFLGIIAAAIGVEEGRKRAEDKLKEAQYQLIQTSKMSAIGQLASGVAHEINNPLTGVLNNVQLIKMEADVKKDSNVTDFRQLLDAIEESAMRCKKITQSLLDFSHASRGLLKPLSFNRVIEMVETLISHELELQNILIKKELQPDLPLVSGEPQLLQQVIFDIISNARWAIRKKGASEKGVITLKTGYDSEKNQVIVSIADTGIGISREDSYKIFEPFFTTKNVGEGTGLGLSIVYNIISAHKGMISVESEPGRGAVFTIALPAIK
ncbi:MAG: PAS domain S-box protein [Candidatus Omnitrophica bacterium]|nr:PAS domain S-box protein [Candidatus Omnitrophota bacterium]